MRRARGGAGRRLPTKKKHDSLTLERKKEVTFPYALPLIPRHLSTL
jgi:hypothetical protein